MRFGAFKKTSAPVLPEALASRVQAWKALELPVMGQIHYQTRYVVLDTVSSGEGQGKDRKDHILSLTALGVSQGRICPDDAFVVSPQGVEDWISFLEFVGKAPLVGYKLSFTMDLLEPLLERELGVAFSPESLDLSVLLPEFFRNFEPCGERLDTWLTHFDIHSYETPQVMTGILVKARLLQRLLVAAQDRGVASPKALLDLGKARRWLHGEG